jgi:thiamine-phosphate pyrophosphorylase
MRPLPRLHAITDAAVVALADFAVRAAALAAAGPAVALHARDRSASGATLTGITRRLLALARPPEASVVVNGRADIAVALEAQGVQLGSTDISPAETRSAFATFRGWIGASVHDIEEARVRMTQGADYLVVGNVYRTSSHPDRPAAGLELVRATAALGLPVIAIGGITPARVAEVRAAGAYGVATISAAWMAADPAAAALALLEPWADAA